MEQSWFAMAVGAGLIFGFLIAWISLRSDRANIYARGKSDADRERASLEERILAKDSRLQELQQSLQQDRETLENLRDENANLRATHQEYDSRVTELRQQSEEKLALVNESQHRLVETLRGTLNEKIQEQEAKVRVAEAEVEHVRQENETLRSAAVQPQPEPASDLLAEREMQLASVLAEALQMRRQIEALEAEKAAWSQPVSSGVGSDLLAERERQLTSVLGEALQLRELVEALEAEKTAALPEAEAVRSRIAELEAEKAAWEQNPALKQRESELAAAVAETQGARERIEALEAEKASAEPVLTSALARVQDMEAERAAWEHPAFAVTAELLKEREAQLATAVTETQGARERIEALEAEKAQWELSAASAIRPEVLAERDEQLTAARAQTEAALAETQAAHHRIEALEAEKASRAPSAADRVALQLLADRDAQLKAAHAAAQESRQRIDSLQAESAAQAAALAEREAHLEQARRQAETIEGEKQARLAEARADIDRLAAELLQLQEQALREHLEAESLRAENARIEAARVEAQAALVTLAQKRVRRAPFSPVRARRVVEMSGLAIHSEFSEAEGESFADVVSIRLPGTKRVIVYSLPDVQPYRDAVNAATEADCAARMGDLAAGVRTHLASVASGGKELAVAFLPGDVLLGAALEQDPGLLEFAAQRGVVVATPNSLVGLLGTAAASWRQHKIAEELQEARAHNQSLFEQLTALAGSLEGLRTNLGATISSFPQLANAGLRAEPEAINHTIAAVAAVEESVQAL